MATTNPIQTQVQVPDKSIMDLFGRQTYLGNAFILPLNGKTVADTIEVPIALITNPAGSAKALFLNERKVSSSSNTVFRFYLNPTVNTTGSATSPVNCRPALATTSVSECYLSSTFSGTAQVQTIDTVADVSGSLNNTYFYISSVNPSGIQKDFYVWFNINSAGTDPSIAGKTGVQVTAATGATANTIATAIRAALNALSSDFVATGATNHVIVTNINVGSVTPAADGGQPTSFTFHNTTPGNVNYGTFTTALSTSANITTESDVLLVLDPGQSLVVTAQVATANSQVFNENAWYEL